MTDEKPCPVAPEPEERYRNALLWLRLIAFGHYLGGAFDPEHMRDIANVAARALSGEDLPDFEESAAKARKRAGRQAQRFGRELAGEDQELLPLLHGRYLAGAGYGVRGGAR